MTFPTTTPGLLGRDRASIAAMLGRIAVAGSLALAVLGSDVPAASAGKSQQIVTKGGIVQFRDRGEVLAATDTRADGYAVRAELYWAGGKAWIADFGFTDGRERHIKVPLREGTEVKLRMCYIAEGHAVRCSHMQRGVA